MILISAINTDFVVKFTTHFFIISFILLALVPIVGIEVKGAKRWLDFIFLDFNQLKF